MFNKAICAAYILLIFGLSSVKHKFLQIRRLKLQGVQTGYKSFFTQKTLCENMEQKTDTPFKAFFLIFCLQK